MIAIVRRQQSQMTTIESDAVEVDEIRIAPLLMPHAQHKKRAGFLIDADNLRDVPIAFFVIWFLSAPVVMS